MQQPHDNKNLLLAIVLFAGLFMFYGKSTVVARVDEVQAGSVAEKTGFKPGDVITAIDGRSIENFGELRQIVYMNGGNPLTFTVKRAEETLKMVSKRCWMFLTNQRASCRRELIAT